MVAAKTIGTERKETGMKQWNQTEEVLDAFMDSDQEDRIERVTVEILTIQRQTERIVLTSAIEIGRRLAEVKGLLPHGQWGEYVKGQLNYSQSTANNFMRIYEEYGGEQDSLFAGAQLQTLGDLSYTKVLRLLALPAEDRVEFVQDNDVEAMSTRELEKALREREEENRQLQEAAKAEAAAHTQEKAKLEEQLRQAQTSTQMAQNREDAARQDRDRLAQQVETLDGRLKKATEAEKAARAALQEARENPEIPESVMEAMRQEVAAETAAKTRKELEAQLEKAQAAAADAEVRLRCAQEAAEMAGKKARLASPEVALVGAYLKGVQDQFSRLCEALRCVAENDPDTGARMKENVRTKVLGSMARALEQI